MTSVPGIPRIGRRAVLTGGAALAAAALTSCTSDRTRRSGGTSGSDPSIPSEAGDSSTAPVAPTRTVSPARPARRVVALSSSDLDCLIALGVVPVAAWTGTTTLPWLPGDTPPSPDWDGTGLPPLEPLLPFAADALAITGADPTLAQLRSYEQIAAVVSGPIGEPSSWKRQLSLLASATGAEERVPRERASGALERWANAQRALGVRSFAVLLATGALPDTSVATLAADAPLCREIRELGFGILARSEPTTYRDLRQPGVQTVRIDPRDTALGTAASHPSVLSLPWALGKLVEGRRPA